MKKLFESATVGALDLRNRLVRSATFEHAFDENESFLSCLLPMYEKLAVNGVAAIITGMVGVDENSRVLPSMIKAYGKNFVPELHQLAQSVHTLGAKLIVQINHCGKKAGQIDGGGSSLGPCDEENLNGKTIKGMTEDEIQVVATHFAKVAERCKEAGADAVQIHAAHGYLLSQFLSPYFNKRTDAYGGSIEKRARIVFEVYDAVRNTVGDNYPVWIKINAKDLVEPSVSLEEFLWVCKELDKRSIDAIEVSGGVSVDAKSGSTQVVRKQEDEGCFASEALQAAEQVAASVISVCGFRTPHTMESWLNKGKIAAFSLCRPLISEPELIGRWERGDTTKSRCISCNQCFPPGLACKAFGKAG